jgi:hypothetical protein
MNVTYIDRIQDTLARVEARLLENKSRIKTYAAMTTAARDADALSEKLRDYWCIQNAPVLVLQLESGRFFLVADLQYIFERSKDDRYLDAVFGKSYEHWIISTDRMVMDSRAAA